jgi:hypothetical protein
MEDTGTGNAEDSKNMNAVNTVSVIKAITNQHPWKESL